MGKKDNERRVYPQEFKAEAVAPAGTGLPPFSGHGRPRDEELTRLRKEVKALRSAV
jgi:hypothetical protein